MKGLIHPTYLPNIAHFVAMAQADTLWYEAADNYQKQTYRNRAIVYGANGALTLTVPVKYTQKARQLSKDIKISNDSSWQLLHWKSLESAYKTSPFFEYYEDELRPLFFETSDYLMAHNFKCIEVLNDCLQLELPIQKTDRFVSTPEDDIKDLRTLVNARKAVTTNFTNYTQVFHEKHGYLENLSILDLLFNEGPNALSYLESQTLPL